MHPPVCGGVVVGAARGHDGPADGGQHHLHRGPAGPGDPPPPHRLGAGHPAGAGAGGGHGGRQVRPEDAGRYLCSLETLPKQSLVLLLQVNGEAAYLAL